MRPDILPNGIETRLGEDEIIVSKTDLKGIITYANKVFLRIACYSEAELLGKPHNLIRHPDMPRCVFKYLWDTLAAGHEVFAYVINLAKNGNHYWVLAHVTPTFDATGRIIGYHSSRRCPDPAIVQQVIPVYKQLLAEEQRHANPREGLAASMQMLGDFLGSQEKTYDEFIWSLITSKGAA